MVELIRKVYGITVPRVALVCALGHTADLLIDEHRKHWKRLALHWLSSSPLSFREYINRVNSNLQLENGVYLKRGTPPKCEKLWSVGLYTPGLASFSLARDRVFGPVPLGQWLGSLVCSGSALPPLCDGVLLCVRAGL